MFQVIDKILAAGNLARVAVLIACAFGALSPPSAIGQSTRTQPPLEVGALVEVRALVTNRQVTSVRFSPNGRYVLAAGPDQSAQLWDSASGRLIRTYPTRNAKTAIFSNDGARVLIGNRDGSIETVDAETGKLVATIAAHLLPIESLALSADGKRLVSSAYPPIDAPTHITDFTVKVWDPLSGQLLRSFTDHTHYTDALAISPDGARVVSAGDGGIRVWDTVSGQTLLKLENADGATSIVFSPDAKLIAATDYSKSVGLWDAQTGQLVREFELGADAGGIVDAAFSADGLRIVAGAQNASIRIWDVATGKVLSEFEGRSVGMVHPAFSPDGALVVAGTISGSTTAVNSLQIWSTANGKVIRKFAAGASGLISMAAVKNDSVIAVYSSGAKARTLACGSNDGLIYWDVQSGRVVQTMDFENCTPFIMRGHAFSPDGSRFAISGFTDNDGGARVWDTRNGRSLNQIGGGFGRVALSSQNDRVLDAAFLNGTLFSETKLIDTNTGQSVLSILNNGGEAAAISPDGDQILLGGAEPTKTGGAEQDNSIGLWQVKSSHLLFRFQTSGLAKSAAFSADGNRIFSGSIDGTVQIWNARNGQLQRTLRGHSRAVTAIALSPDSRLVLTGSDDQTARLWRVDTGQSLHTFEGHSDDLRSVAFSSDGARIFTGGIDAIKVWDTQTGALLATLIAGPAQQWVAITPEGFFNASEHGAELITVVRGFQSFSIDQFYQALYRPDLVRQKLAGDPNGLVKEAAAKLDLSKVIDSGSAPVVAITSPRDGSSAAAGEINVEASVTEQGGGVGRIEWRLNGQPVGIETRGLERIQDGAATAPSGATVRISQKMVPDAGDNVVEVIAYNSRGLVASQPARITIKAAGPAAVTKPRLFVLSVGVNDYYDGRLKLNFAVPDARAMAASFEKAGTGLYQSVKSVTVLDSDVTRANLEKVFAQLASEVKTTDVFVFFIAGHGRTLEGHYYFLPQDFRYLDQGSYAENGLSQEQWQKWIALVQARKSVLIYDTCESGTVASDNLVVASRGTQAVEEQAVAYQKLRDATGKTILAASTDTQPALEGYHGHGVFSYVVMEALEKAQTNANGLIEVTGLISYVDDKVPEISFQAFHQRQIPQNKMLGSNFALAKPVPSLSGATPANATRIATAKPTYVVIAPTDVYQKPGGKGARIQQLPPGTQVTLVETSAGWSVIAKDGTNLGFVKQEALAKLQ
jgi:WD40 repeat protein/uncharacterized caspase-like protein